MTPTVRSMITKQWLGKQNQEFIFNFFHHNDRIDLTFDQIQIRHKGKKHEMPLHFQAVAHTNKA